MNEITGKLWFSTIWSESLQRPIINKVELIGGNVIGMSHELLSDLQSGELVRLPDGYQHYPYRMRYIGEYADGHYPPQTSLYEVTEIQGERF